SLARPGGNATGFASFQYAVSGKHLELLKQIAPGLSRVAVVRESGPGARDAQLRAVQAAAALLKVELHEIAPRGAADLARGVEAFAREPGGGLIVTAGAPMQQLQRLIVRLAQQYRLPSISGGRSFAAAGGLICYGPDQLDLYRRAAEYVDRIFKG